MTPDNALHIRVRLFDMAHDVNMDIGRYENVMLQDLDVGSLIKDIRQASMKAIKQFEIDMTNLQKG